MELTIKEREMLQERLRSEMIRRGIQKQNQFAKLCGITPSYMGMLLSGGRIGGRIVIRIAQRLNVPIGYLLGYEDLPYKIPPKSQGEARMFFELLNNENLVSEGLIGAIRDLIKKAYTELIKKKQVIGPAVIISLLPYLK